VVSGEGEGPEACWCLHCGVASACDRWDGGCPHCGATTLHRFPWAECRRMRPGLPERPTLGEVYRLSDH
jgi:hypothetical protein